MVQNLSTADMELSKQQESDKVKHYLWSGISEMKNYTLKVHLLAVCLSDRDP
jgi:hypothetical protein